MMIIMLPEISHVQCLPWEGEIQVISVRSCRIRQLVQSVSVVMKMLFLSSPAAQKGYVNGVVPPGSKELSVTDYRGY